MLAAVEEDTKICNKCSKEKPTTEFGSHGSGTTRVTCKLCINQYERERYLKRKTTNLCTKCGRPANSSHCDNCAKKLNPKLVKWRLKSRDRLFEMYGGRCVCCGETNFIFLTIDHMNNDGNIERKKNKRAGTSIYHKLIKLGRRPDLQLMCYNCNCGRYRNGGICPHVQERFVNAMAGLGEYDDAKYCDI